MSIDWRDEHDAYLLELCAAPEKYSAPIIASLISIRFEISPPLTRASVVGRARRKKIALPISRLGKTSPGTDVAPPPFVSALVNPRPRLDYSADKRQTKRGTILPEPKGAPGIYLLNASDRDCRFPISKSAKGAMEQLRVCGEPAMDASSYCETCHRRAFTRVSVSGNIFVLPTKLRGLK